jgi:asparagine synthetase B (glutamine-hydrolysing)
MGTLHGPATGVGDVVSSRPLQARSFVVDSSGSGAAPIANVEEPLTALGGPSYEEWSSDGSMRVQIDFRDADDTGDAGKPSNTRVIVIGDDSEWSPAATCLGNAVVMQYNLRQRRVDIYTSITGLPPVFLYEGPSRVVVASDVRSLREWPGVDFAFDPQAVRDVCRIGYPVDFRTLFAGIRVVPGGSVIQVEPHGKVTLRPAWNMPEACPERSWEAYTDLQATLFTDAVRRLDLSATFLSLTAGLDTRAILAALLADGRALSAYTMSWKDRSLDARTARRLCGAYGLTHETVRFDESFTMEFPDRVLEASRLSGGLAATDQATEVAFYHCVGGRWRARLSGHLGNQVGRGGMEQISRRGGDTAMLGEGMRLSGADGGDQRSEDHLPGGGSLGRLSALNREVPNALIANYSIGHHFMVQRSPYATRELIEAIGRAPADGHANRPRSPLRMRFLDLRHRFLGDPVHRSFQRKVISRVGGYVATCPVNWGWRVQGGVSPMGAFAGLLAFLDALAASNGLEGGIIGRALETLQIPARHDFRQLRKWCSREFLYDTLRRRELREEGLFDMRTLERMLDEHFAGVIDHHVKLMLALDLACAQQVFLSPKTRKAAAS